MTDNEIIKALECCRNGLCTDCPRLNTPAHILLCKEQLMCEALDLINRQKAEIKSDKHYYNECLKELAKAKVEIERLSTEYANQSRLWSQHYESIFESAKETIKAEAVGKFAERLTDKADLIKVNAFDSKWAISQEDIDNLVKEMVGES